MLWMGKSYHCALNKSFICHNWNGYFVSVSQKYLAARTEKTKFHNFCLLDHFYVIMPFGSNVWMTQKRSIMFLVDLSVCLFVWMSLQDLTAAIRGAIGWFDLSRFPVNWTLTGSGYPAVNRADSHTWLTLFDHA